MYKSDGSFLGDLREDYIRLNNPILKNALLRHDWDYPEKEIIEYLRRNLSEFEKERCIIKKYLDEYIHKDNILDKMHKIIYNVITKII